MHNYASLHSYAFCAILAQKGGVVNEIRVCDYA